ncbi:ribbon-helix-helix domain-containing protein [Luteimonas changyuni]
MHHFAKERTCMSGHASHSVRTSFTLSRLQHERLSELALRSGVSVAWLIRYAVQELLDNPEAGQLPLPIKRAMHRDAD